MIELNGKKFALNNKEFTDSLFHKSGGTCVGYYKVNKKTISLMDHNREKVGVITCHKVLARATKQDNGKYWYSYGDIDIIGKYDSYMKESEEIQALVYKYLV